MTVRLDSLALYEGKDHARLEVMAEWVGVAVLAAASARSTCR